MNISHITPLDCYSAAPTTLPPAVSHKHVSTSDSETEAGPERPRRYRKRHLLEKTRSTSMHDLIPNGEGDNGTSYVPSQILVTRTTSRGGSINPNPRHSIAVVDAYNPYVSEPDHVHRQHIINDHHGYNQPVTGTRTTRSIPNLSTDISHQHTLMTRKISEGNNRNGYMHPTQNQSNQDFHRNRTTSIDHTPVKPKQIPLGASRLVTRNLSRQESQSSSHSGNSYSNRLLSLSKSEGSLTKQVSTSESDSSSFRDRQMHEKRTQNSSIVYYGAEIHRYMTAEVQEFAKQMVCRTTME